MTERMKQNDEQATMFSDSEMDGMLKAFFRMEMPRTFQPPVLRQPVVEQSSKTISLTIPLSDRAEAIVGHRERRNWVMAMTLATLAFSVMLIVSGHSHNTISTARNAESRQNVPSDTGSMMLVSPRGESAQADQPVSEDGLLLRETEQIELSPRLKD